MGLMYLKFSRSASMIRAQPLDACIIIGGCDKTVPAQLIGGISANKPAVYRAGDLDIEEIAAVNKELAPTIGTCGVMGTASTMACLTAALGIMPLRGASAPTILSKASFLNAIILKPSGDNYMTDFYNAGGIPALLCTLRPLLYISAITIPHAVLNNALFRPLFLSQAVICLLSDPLYPSVSLVVLYRNITLNGAVIKASASKDCRLLSYPGPAVVLDNTANLAKRINNPARPVTRDSVLVLKDIGPVGNPDMPEVGLLDRRMSGTAGGTIVLHISPKSGLPESPFRVRRKLSLEVLEEELAARIEARKRVFVEEVVVQERRARRGYRGLYMRFVNQAHVRVDFDFLIAE
ncbi:uncharacterized protein BDW43DRAFT_295929 [Aspergillus alliaceus]|uniref:uncharacterized protein n=1 Tax=Petromyces alliaceus TaxID=209559 RepID=UPI0012A3E2B2|nr:uncharacterized protein BDW43DRAFT_295929 [Aspergillus alliaceus]KAB8239520.1 hypothetical protein BDW43DRAFT_295929 [Aspergillus alliaceus]